MIQTAWLRKVLAKTMILFFSLWTWKLEQPVCRGTKALGSMIIDVCARTTYELTTYGALTKGRVIEAVWEDAWIRVGSKQCFPILDALGITQGA